MAPPAAADHQTRDAERKAQAARSLRRRLVVYAVAGLLIALGAAWLFRPVLAFDLLYHPQRGDVVFQSLPPNGLVLAIEGTTRSPYSHCGVVDRIDGRWVVVEAIGTVHATPLRQWMLRGRGCAVTVLRYPLSDAEADRALAAVHRYDDRPYDSSYDLDDQRIYCSELVWKGWRDGLGINLGKLCRLGDLDWKPFTALIEQHEHGPVPVEREMITPAAVAADPRLVKVFDSY